MTEVKPNGSSAQDAGKTTETDLNVVAPAEPNNVTDAQQEAAEETSQDTEVVEATDEQAVEGDEATEHTEADVDEATEETNEDGRAEHLQQKQEKNAARKIQEVSQKLVETQKRLEAFENVQEQMVRANPNHLYVIAQTDAALADKMVGKIFGEAHGIETLEELKLLADRNKSDAQHKPLYDQQLATMKKLRRLEKEDGERKAAAMQAATNSFRTAHPEFRGELQKKTLEIQERSKGAFTLEESFEMARGLVKPSQSSENAAVKVAQNKAGVRGGGESKVGMGKGKTLTQNQIDMANRFKLDPKKVY